MKKYLFIISILSIGLFLGCYDDDISYDKPGEPIDPVANLTATPQGEEVVISWTLPSSYPNDVIQPVSVQINVSIDGRREGGNIVLEGNPTSFTHPYDANRSYRFTVKVLTHIETSEPHESDLRLSLGQTVEI